MHGWRTASYTRTRCGSGARTWTRDALNEAVTAYELVFGLITHKVRVFYTSGKFQKLSHLDSSAQTPPDASHSSFQDAERSFARPLAELERGDP